MGLVKLGSTGVLKHFPGHGWHSGTVVSFCRPHFLIRYRDGDTEDLLGHQLAKVLHLGATCFTDPRAWYYDWSYMHPADVKPWRSACEHYCRAHGIDLPSSWLSGSTKPPIVLNEGTSDHEPARNSECLRMYTRWPRILICLYLPEGRCFSFL